MAARFLRKACAPLLPAEYATLSGPAMRYSRFGTKLKNFFMSSRLAIANAIPKS